MKRVREQAAVPERSALEPLYFKYDGINWDKSYTPQQWMRLALGEDVDVGGLGGIDGEVNEAGNVTKVFFEGMGICGTLGA